MATPGPVASVVNDDDPSLYLLARHLRGAYRLLEAQSGAQGLLAAGAGEAVAGAACGPSASGSLCGSVPASI